MNTYVVSMNYENLIKLAHNCETGMRYGAHQSFMQNAMTMEQGKSFAKHLGSFEKQFGQVKTNILIALDKLSSKKPYSAESEFFIAISTEVNHATSTSELNELIEACLIKIDKL